MNPSSWLQGALVNGAEATVLALVVWAITRRIRHAGFAHILWCAVLVDLVAPPLLTVPVARVVSRARIEPEVLDVAEERAPELPAADPELAWRAWAPPGIASWTAPLPPDDVGSTRGDASPDGTAWRAADLAAGAWVVSSLAFLLFTLGRALAFHGGLRSARSAPAALQEIAADRARRAGLSRPPEVLLIDAKIPPLVWALCGRARLILPAPLIDRLGAIQVEMLVAHEIAHMARRDHWLRWPEAIVVGLYWWCPAAWWARSGLRRAEEDCCDGHVREAFPGAPLEYAKALMETVDFLSTSRPIPAMASGLGREGRILKRRFDMILDRAPGHRLPRPLRAVLIAALAVLIPLSPAIVAGEDDVKPDTGEGKPDDTVEKPHPDKDPRWSKEGAAKEDWSHRAPAGDMEARLASLEKQVASLLAEIKKSRAADTDPDSDYRKVQNYPVKDKLPWKKWVEDNPPVSGGRAFHIEKNLLLAIDPDTQKELWVTKLPFDDPKIQVMDKLVHVTDGRSIIVLDAGTGKLLKEARYAQDADSGDKLDPKHRKLWEKNALPRVADSDDKVRPDKNRIPRVSDKIPTLEELKAEKKKLRDRLAEIEAMEATLQAADKYYWPAK